MIRNIRTPLVLLIAFMALGFTAEKLLLSPETQERAISIFTSQLQKKQIRALQLINETEGKIENTDSVTASWFFERLWHPRLFEEEGIGILITRNASLAYWSDQSLGFSQLLNNPPGGLLRLPNGWYLHNSIKKQEFTIHSLILIKYQYPIENDFLLNNFAKNYKLPNEYEIIPGTAEGAYPVEGLDNQILFSITPSGIPCAYPLLAVPVSLYLIGLIMFLFIVYRISIHYFHKHPLRKLLVILLLLLGFYSLINYVKIPTTLFMLKLFSPQWFAFTSFWPSLGQFLFFCFLLLFWSALFFRSFELPYAIKSNTSYRFFCVTGGLFLLAAYFVFIRFLFLSLIMNSGISFALYRIQEINVNSLFGYLSLAFLLFSSLLLTLRFTQLFRKHIPAGYFLLLITVIFTAFSGLLFVSDPSGTLRLTIFFWIIPAVSFLFNRKGLLSHRLTQIVILVFCFTLFLLSLMVPFTEKHEKKIQHTLAVNLSSEHDPTAELFLYDIDLEIQSDTLLELLLLPPFDGVEEYLRRKHFAGYFREYDFQATLCYESDSLVIQPGNLTMPCFPFFEERLAADGSQIPGTHFYFMDNANGRITYSGKFEFELPVPLNLYIELNSKLLSEGAGFPELLIPRNSLENRLKNQFSFAKYSNGTLVDRGGSYSYALTSDAYNLQNEGIYFRKWNGNDHCIYGFPENNYVIVSRKNATVYDYLIAFPYIFVFLFIMMLILNGASRPFSFFTEKGKSLRKNIQYSIIGIVLGSLLIVGGGTIFYIVRQYRANHQKELVDRMNSISLEVENSLENLSLQEPDERILLSYELIRLSDIFRTDIHLFNLSGRLIATSRPEIFNKGLIAPLMNNEALINISLFRLPRYLHREHIAGMDFLSAYIPLFNEAGEETGYLNLPYFTQQKEFRQEITTFILAFFNLYVFLLLASILVAYFISEKMTVPLKLIRDNLRSVQLGKNPKPIRYVSNDEIGALVLEYNNKVEELAASADLLARSERETAWREMARQIAHEINNPLTPMKLNVQFLQRSTPSNSDEYKQMVKKVANTLIEQIDNLSAIASEFSNFAKMPRANNERFILEARLREIIGLYDYAEEYDFELQMEGAETFEVVADKEQFARAMINLIKNAQQAIPDNSRGKITFSIRRENDQAIIQVTDNGKGIPESLKDRIFTPNFTTKTSGTGLGLAITKNIIESFGGKIWFTSEEEKGSSFFIKIPLS